MRARRPGAAPALALHGVHATSYRDRHEQEWRRLEPGKLRSLIVCIPLGTTHSHSLHPCAQSCPCFLEVPEATIAEYDCLLAEGEVITTYQTWKACAYELASDPPCQICGTPAAQGVGGRRLSRNLLFGSMSGMVSDSDAGEVVDSGPCAVADGYCDWSIMLAL